MKRARAVLLALLPDDPWSREFVEELDEELTGRGEVAYLLRLLAPGTLRFIWLMRRRRRRRGRSVRLIVGGFGSVLRDARVDGRQAVRALLRQPRAAIFIVATLALGIGSVSAMYGVAERLFLGGPRHVTAPDELVRLFLAFDDAGGRRVSPWIPYRSATAIQEGSTPFSDVAVYRREERLARVGAEVVPVQLAEVDGRYFELLGVRPAAGRFFGSEAAAGDGGPVVVSESLARSRFGSAAAAIGSGFVLGQSRGTVVGVAPEGFAGPHLERIDAWVALDASRAGNRNWWLVGRLPGGADRATVARTAAAADAIHRRTDPGRSFQWALAGRVELTEVGSDDAGRTSTEASVARLLLLVVATVLLIACANVVNLLLARLASRRGELVVRLALGIGRWRLVRHLMSESLLLGLLGGLFGVPVAWVSGLLLRRVLLPEVAWTSAPVDGRVLAVGAVVAVLTGIVLSLLPIRHAFRTDLSSGLASDRHTAGGRNSGQTALVATQVALSAALLLCAGLFLKSFWTIRVTELGFRPDVLAVHLRSLDESAIRPGSDAERDLYERALRVASEVPGVRAATLTVGVPFLSHYGQSLWVPGLDSVPELPGGGPYVSAVGPGYFDAVGTPIVAGSAITEEDALRGELVVVVSSRTARTLWPGADPLTRCVRVGRSDEPCARVVGIAADVHRMGYREPPSLQLYLPIGLQEGFFGTTLVVSPHRDGGRARAALGEALRRMDPRVDHVDIVRLDALVEDQVRPWRLGAVVLTLTALVAVLVSLVGVYGVLSYAVVRRRREIGVRIAFGATRSAIEGLVLRTGMIAGAGGLLVGIALVLAGSPWLSPLLFETPVHDPLVLAAVSALLLAAAAAACVLPAGQAARVDPVTCLKSEG